MKKFTSLLLASSLAFSLFAADKKSVLVIESYNKEFGWDASYLEGIKELLGAEFEVKAFELDTKRLPKEQWQAKADEAWKLYESTKPIAVIIGDDAGLNMLGKKFEETKTPVVFLGINNNPRRYVTLGKNITGILERPLMKRSAVAIKEMIPSTKKILILFDNDTTSKVIFEEEFGGKESATLQDIEADIKLAGTKKEWEETISNARGKYDAIIVGLYQAVKDENGKSVPANDILGWTSKNTGVPLFGFWDFSVGEGKTSGGLVLYGKTQGQAAAQLVKDVLGGADITQINPKVGEKGRYLYNKKELERFKLKVPGHIEKSAEYN